MAKLVLTADELITSTKATRELPRLLDRLPEKRWFIQRNNKLEGVLLGIAEYERLLELEEESRASHPGRDADGARPKG